MKTTEWIKQPVFLVGAERSGTTVLRLMLDHHPEIAFRQEFEFAVDRISENGQWPGLADYYDWLSMDRIFQASGFQIDPERDYPQLINSFLIQKRNRDGKSIVGATVHRHFDRLKWIWPDARFIHLIRDGRDVARSCIGMGWAGNVYTGIERWIGAERLWEKLKAGLDPADYIEIRFEDLIRDTRTVLDQVCRFMGTRYHDAMLDYTKKTTYEAPDPKLIEQWRRKQSPKEIQLVESRIADMLVDRGYPLSGLPRLTVTRHMRYRLLIQDRLAGWQFGIRRFGLFLILADNVTRRLGFSAPSRRIRKKIDTIAASHIQ